MSMFIFVRHGQSDGNANGYIANADTKLTEVMSRQKMNFYQHGAT